MVLLFLGGVVVSVLALGAGKGDSGPHNGLPPEFLPMVSGRLLSEAFRPAAVFSTKKKRGQNDGLVNIPCGKEAVNGKFKKNQKNLRGF